jgi:pyruvate dehydrogenase E1 component alpha subunit
MLETKPSLSQLPKNFGLTNEQLVAAYRTMLLARLLDQKAISLHNQGKIGSYTSSAGHEAAQVGSVYGLEPNDYIFPYYRDQGVLLARGVTPEQLLNRFIGNAADEIKGRDLPNLWSYRENRIFSIAAPIASNLQISVGFAMAAKMRKEDLVTIAYFGEGATSSGEFHVAMNFAGVYRTPSIFVCENNRYAISVPVKRQTASETISVKAKAYGIEGVTVDGNDFFEVQEAVASARKRAASGGGATLIECLTYRFSPHSSADDWKRYRTSEEVEEWKKRDPIALFKNLLVTNGIMAKEVEKEIADQVQGRVNKAARDTANIPDPPIESLIENVFAEIPRNLKEEFHASEESSS